MITQLTLNIAVMLSRANNASYSVRYSVALKSKRKAYSTSNPSEYVSTIPA